MNAARTGPYVVITPARDEAEYIERTIESMLRQTLRPAQWIIVNDGSGDGTGEIVDDCAASHSWITAVHLPRKKQRESGCEERASRAVDAKEIKAFYKGAEYIRDDDWKFIVKLDADLGFGPEFFEKCLTEFDADDRLGIAGGAIWNLVDGELKYESAPSFHVRGATKIYRRKCWDDIGGVLHSAGWDTLDLVKANMLGWSTRTIKELRVVHYRYTGAANGAWKNAVKNGRWSYIAGYHPLYMLVRCANNLLQRPYLIGSCGLLSGFLGGYVRRVPRTQEQTLIRYVRQQQLRRLSFRTTIWK